MLSNRSDIKELQEKWMIHTKDHKTGHLLDPWRYMGKKRRKLLEQSWAGLFREHILSELPVDKIAPFFSSDMGRPTKELYTVLGVLVIQQMQDFSDKETLYQLAFNEQWRYALDITSESDDAAYMSSKTLWNMRKVVMDHNLDKIIFQQVTGELARVFKVDTTKQRLDSVHIRSNMRRLGRIRIFSETIHKFLINLKRQDKVLYEQVNKKTSARYITKKALSCFSMVKPSETPRTLKEVSTDLFELITLFSKEARVTAMHSYKLMARIFEEQCHVVEDASKKPEVFMKAVKEISSDSLQNPSDPDATYDGHKGQGYQVQLIETFSDKEKSKEDKAQTLNLITHVEVQEACDSDAKALIPVIEATKKQGLGAKEILVDSLYGSDANVTEAQKLGVEIISPAMGSNREGKLPLSSFTFTKRGKTASCPGGHIPVKTKHKKERHTAHFKVEHCCHCPHLQEGCPVKQGKKYYSLRYSDKEQRIAERRVLEETEAFKEKYRWRAGVEATMSEYDRRTGVKNLRVRGFEAVRFCATLKAAGINIFRATAVQKALSNGKEACERALLSQKQTIHTFIALKRRFLNNFDPLRDILTSLARFCGNTAARTI